MSKHRITKVWVDDTHVYAMTETGLTANYAFFQWPKLAKATREQREDYQLSYSGIHWPQIDEDLNFESMSMLMAYVQLRKLKIRFIILTICKLAIDVQ